MKNRANDTADKGQALLEFAVVLPLLVLLLLGVFDFARAIRTNNTISNMSREGVNMASRSSLAPQDIMNALAATAQPLTMQSNGMIYITMVQGVAGGSPQIQTQVGWQNSSLKNTIQSRIGTPTAGNPNPTALNLAALNLAAGQTSYVVEVFYNFQSLFPINVAKLGGQFYSRTVL